MLDRRYGIEIETVAPSGLSQAGVAKLISDAGVPCIAAGYSHSVIPQWKVTTDASVLGHSHAQGQEIVSPPLRGENGFEQVEVVSHVLLENGFAINKHCGLHVHVDAKEPNLGMPAFKRLALLYAESEAIIDMLLPPSRRGNANSWCRSVAAVDPRKIMAATDASGLAKALAPNAGRDDDKLRYTKLNFTSYWRYGTVEFRHHSGTLEARKIIEWTKACLRMVRTAETEHDPEFVNAQQAARVIRTVRAGTKHEVVHRLLTRPEGCTTQEVLDATGWRQASVKGIASGLGLSVRTEKTSGQLRYWGYQSVNPPGVQTPTPTLNKPTTIESFAERIGMTDDEKKFWLRRAALFAGPSATMAQRPSYIPQGFVATLPEGVVETLEELASEAALHNQAGD